jgi:hypothetical protein
MYLQFVAIVFNLAPKGCKGCDQAHEHKTPIQCHVGVNVIG